MKKDTGSRAAFEAVKKPWSWLFQPGDSRTAAGIRIGLFLLLAWRLIQSSGRYFDISKQPQELFDPVSLFHLLPKMPGPEFVVAFLIPGVAASLLAAAGVLPRWSFPVAFVSGLLLNLMLSSAGKIMHNDVLLMLCLIPLLLAPTAASRSWALSWRRHLDNFAHGPRQAVAYGFVIRLSMMIVAIAYFAAGVQKLRFSGWDWFLSDNLSYLLLASSDSQSVPNQLAIWVADLGPIVHLFAFGAIAIELFFFLCLPYRRLRYLLVPGVISMHLSIYLTMGLDYSAQMLTVLVVFVNWAWLANLKEKEELEPIEVFYDDDCGFCKWSLAKILALDTKGLLMARSIQESEAELHSVKKEDLYNSWHARVDGKIYSGGDAGEPVFSRVAFGKLPAFISRRCPRTTRRAYSFIARKRNTWSRLLGIDATCSITDYRKK